MKPVDFDESNIVLGPPESMTEEECGNLPVFTDGRLCVSRWKLSPEELETIQRTGSVWLAIVSGSTQPPVWLSVEETVFISESE